MRYFLLDKITEYKHKESSTGLKAITLTDPILHDHFPDYPILPGAMIIEGLAQLAGFLLESSFNAETEEVKRAILVQVEKMKFYKTSGPGEVLTYKAEINSLLEDAAKVTVTAMCGDEVRTKGRLTFQMMGINSDNITKQRLDIYKIWTKGLENCPTLK